MAKQLTTQIRLLKLDGYQVKALQLRHHSHLSWSDWVHHKCLLPLMNWLLFRGSAAKQRIAAEVKKLMLQHIADARRQQQLTFNQKAALWKLHQQAEIDSASIGDHDQWMRKYLCTVFMICSRPLVADWWLQPFGDAAIDVDTLATVPSAEIVLSINAPPELTGVMRAVIESRRS